MDDHASEIDGKYFNFNKAGAQAKLGITIPDGETGQDLTLQCVRTGESGEMKVWGYVNGGSTGDSHGRKNPFESAAPGDWVEGDCLTLPCSGIQVSSVDHVSGTVGKYFNFDSTRTNALLGHTLASAENIHVRCERTGETTEMRVWNAVNGGSTGDAHGRKNPLDSAAAGDWVVGDCLAVVDKPAPEPAGCQGITVLSVDHSSGPPGKYFNFDADDAMALLGRDVENEERFTFQCDRTGQTSAVMVWNYKNGGSSGDRHGRKNPMDSSAAGDWQIGDCLTLAD